MNRRQRKKNRVGEFTEYGFDLGFSYPGTGNCPIDEDHLYDNFIELVERFGLEVGGGIDTKRINVFVTSATKYESPTNEQINALVFYLENLGFVNHIAIRQDANK